MEEEVIVSVIKNEEIELNEYESLVDHQKAYYDLLVGQIEEEEVKDLQKEREEQGFNTAFLKDKIVRIRPKSKLVVLEYSKYDGNNELILDEIFVYKNGIWFVF